jgi:hypothetical protein
MPEPTVRISARIAFMLTAELKARAEILSSYPMPSMKAAAARLNGYALELDQAMLQCTADEIAQTRVAVELEMNLLGGDPVL